MHRFCDDSLFLLRSQHSFAYSSRSRPVELLEDVEGLEAANEWPRSWIARQTGWFFLRSNTVITATVFAIPAVQHLSGTYVHKYTRT